MATLRSVHVIPSGSGCWQVIRAGRVLSTHRTQRRAIAVGTALARRRRVELVTHGRNGRIRSKDTYRPRRRREGHRTLKDGRGQAAAWPRLRISSKIHMLSRQEMEDALVNLDRRLARVERIICTHRRPIVPSLIAAR